MKNNLRYRGMGLQSRLESYTGVGDVQLGEQQSLCGSENTWKGFASPLRRFNLFLIPFEVTENCYWEMNSGHFYAHQTQNFNAFRESKQKE
ncbi:hypothetical protein CK203_007752 [Vitis vinifera]|uniref:Uncharacterized protein n=1 Tax=Vitis vinifera TaxID=29760 RepID=A0A438K138_VITVI|nr:hypothetical protein CK203_007752 [Vitis vinifera]